LQENHPPRAVREEFANPVQMGFCATLPVGMTLLAGGLAPYVPPLADVLWWTGVVLLLAMQVWGLQRLLAGGIELEQVNAGWMILFIGGIVVPGAGLQLGHPLLPLRPGQQQTLPRLLRAFSPVVQRRGLRVCPAPRPVYLNQPS
jgi:tellurite resistance protein TehA-like permease